MYPRHARPCVKGRTGGARDAGTGEHPSRGPRASTPGVRTPRPRRAMGWSAAASRSMRAPPPAARGIRPDAPVVRCEVRCCAWRRVAQGGLAGVEPATFGAATPKSGWHDSHVRPLAPEASALLAELHPGCTEAAGRLAGPLPSQLSLAHDETGPPPDLPATSTFSCPFAESACTRRAWWRGADDACT